MPDGFSLPSFAKINWTLRILGKREDGFHELFTIFQTISLHDTLHFEEANEISLSCDDPKIPIDERNLIIQAARSLRRGFDTNKGARIHLEKRIPSPGGLGGGSSNAATALAGLARLWHLDNPPNDASPFLWDNLHDELGSDVPFFQFGGTAWGYGRGNVIFPVADIDPVPYMLVVTPIVHVSTRDAFSSVRAPTLTDEERKRTLTVCQKAGEALYSGLSNLINDFEPTVFEAHPEIRRVRDTLLELGASNAALSGSGASVYAVFDKKETRQAAQKALDHESTWRKFAVSTISRSEYAKALGI